MAKLSIGQSSSTSALRHLIQEFRKYELYTLHWKVADLSEYIVAGARYGGPLGQLHLKLSTKPSF